MRVLLLNMSLVLNYPNDKVYPEDEKNGWVRLEEDTGPPDIYRFEGSCQNYMDLNEYTPGEVFDDFLKTECGQYWVKILINMFRQNSDQAKDNGDKDPIELLNEGVDQNPCAWLNNWQDTSPDEMSYL